jgi:hypothetical protein
MNREIIVGFVKEHEEACLHASLSTAIRATRICSFCQNANRDSLLLITRMHEARKTLDVGLALSPTSRPEPYKPYTTAGFALFRQNHGTESERIHAVFDEAFERGYESVIIVAHGAPNIPIEHLEYGLHELRNGKNIVLGPTSNGNFYLIGMKKAAYRRLIMKGLFDVIDFSNRENRDISIGRIREATADLGILPEWYIVRSLDDLKRLREDSSRGRGWNARWTTCMIDGIIESR